MLCLWSLIDLLPLLSGQESTEKPETMSTKDAAMFPFIASFVLLSIYVVFKVSCQTVSERFVRLYLHCLLKGHKASV